MLFKITQVKRGILMIVACIATSAHAMDANTLVTNTCASCHQLKESAPEQETLAKKMTSKAPPLHYAGHKYQTEWLEGWLQNPIIITPTGGGYWANNVIVTDEGDEIDSSKLQSHMALSSDQAKAISQYLATLQPYPELIDVSAYQPKKVSALFAQKDFRKFKGCAACHRDEESFGGVTGPELYSAMNRLQVGYVESFIRNPTAWEPYTMMPHKELNDASIYKLMNYLTLISGENK